MLAVLLVAALMLSGCLGSPTTTPTPTPTPTTDTSKADPLAAGFKATTAIGSATDADKFGDVNPFGYHNPLR